jgi:PilZ domain
MSATEDQPAAAPAETAAHARRQVRRLPLGGLLVAIDAPEVSPQPWVVEAIDLNSRGMGLMLPPELPPGARVALTFKLGGGFEASRLPATVLHSRSDGVGAVGFEPWPDAERLELLEYLVGRHEGVVE